MATFSLEIEPVIPEDSLDRIALIRELARLYAAAPLVRFRCREKLSPTPPVGYVAFTWRFEFVDGREWEETHCFATPPTSEDPWMAGVFGDYPTNKGYHISEVALLRPIRDLTFRMVPAFSITDLHAKWV